MRPLLRALALLASYAAPLALLAWPWLAAADRAIPAGPADPGDSRLLAYQLAWVAHALATAPAAILDAPIFHPAPRQLTGTEGFFSTALAFAPLFWATGNATLAASLTAFATYPIAALAMNRLAAALGCGAAAAWVAGLFFALGPLRVPANLMTFHTVNLWLPVVALAATRLRERASPARAAVLAIALALGLLSGFYMAVMLLVATAVWCAIEAARRGPDRGRFVALAAIATAAALVPLAIAALPYLGRREASLDDPLAAMRTDTGVELMMGIAGVVLRDVGWLEWGLAAAGALALLSRSSGGAARRAAGAGLVLATVGAVLMLGRSLHLGGVDVPLPFELLARSPARFFRVPWRFVVVTGFGTALLVAGLLEALRRRAGARVGLVAGAAVAIALVATRGRVLPGARLDEIGAQHAAIYDDLRAIAAGADAAPLLELPLQSVSGLALPEAMLGSVRHGLPLVYAHTGYRPAHAALLRARIAELPRGGDLDEIVDMTHLRWILLRPADEWPRPDERRAILRRSDLEPVATRDGFDLLRVRREPLRPQWYDAIARGPRPGVSVLGTSFAPLESPRGAVRASIDRDRAAPGQLFVLRTEVENAGAQAWPAAILSDDPKPLGVKLAVRIVPDPHPGGDVAPAVETTVNLWRDVPAGDRLAMAVPIAAPREPGRYRVEVGLVQPAGPPFAVADQGGDPPRLEVSPP